MSTGLPRGLEAMLRRMLPRDLADPIAGDLLEEYGEVRRRSGYLRAATWAWWTGARLAATFRWERLSRVRSLPPIADEIRSTTNMWDALRQDVIFSARMLRRQPGFTFVALLALALGIGTTTAIFGIVDAALWRPLPYAAADRVMSLAEQRPREGRWFGPVAPADYFDWRRDNHSFAAMAAYSERVFNMTGSGEPERVSALEVSPAFLAVLGMAPAVGRDFHSDEEIYGRHRLVLLTDGLWRRRFGADRSVVGRTVAFDGNAFEVVGILPPRFWWPSQPDVVVPLAFYGADASLRAAHFLDVIGRLRDGASVPIARDDLRIIGDRLSQAFPEENRYHSPNLRPLRDALVGDVRQTLLVLLGAVAFVMLIACANVATLLLARAAGRQQELAVRRAVGATRGRVVRQVLTESLVVAFIGGAAGLIVAAWGLAAFRSLAPSQFAELPGVAGVAIDARVLAASIALSAITGIVFGVIPALVASDHRLGASLTEQSRGGSGSPRTRRLRSSLIIAELALSMMLLAGAALLIVSFNHLINVAPGFEPAQLVTTRITLPSTRYGDHARTSAFFEALYDRLRTAPGVQHVAAATSLPFTGPDSRLNLEIEHRAEQSPLPVRAHPRLVSPDYFSTMGIPVVRGRGFTNRDHDGSTEVAIINEAAARRYWPADDPIGQRISLGSPPRWREVVGIAGDTRHEGLDADAEPAVYMPHRQIFLNMGNGFERAMTIVVRTNADAASMTPIIRASVGAVDPQVPIGMVRPMPELIADSVAPRRLSFVLVSAFAGVALVLTAAGLYGVMAYIVAQRTREIGVRMALGASRSQVLALMFRQIGGMTGAGIALGVAGALVATRSMTSLLFGVSAADPPIYAGMALLLALVAVAAVAVPSSRATRIDPLVALREP